MKGFVNLLLRYWTVLSTFQKSLVLSGFQFITFCMNELHVEEFFISFGIQIDIIFNLIFAFAFSKSKNSFPKIILNARF